ncbi:hypothetical protein PYV61_18945 [Roseisolibacter sp. H3M3-2]|nr:hypothetical protein [Roseisolibacter sp. H3M3-2]
MTFPRPAFRLVRTAALLSTLALAVTACDDDDDVTGDDEPDIESVRLVVTPSGGTPTTYTVTANGATPTPVQLRVGTSTIVATPLDAGGATIDESSEFELRMSGLPAGVTFTQSGTLSATIAATAATTTSANVSAIMWHRSEGHDDFTANFPLRVVQ